jgi:hypothetical protein
MCCKLMGVPELEKPANRWCPHCDVGKGCMIYKSRPPSCQKFQCLWLQSQMAEELRPDQTHVVLFGVGRMQDGTGIWNKDQADLILRQLPEASVVMLVDRGYEQKWIDGPVRPVVEDLRERGEVIAVVEGSLGHRPRRLILPDAYEGDPRTKRL